MKKQDINTRELGMQLITSLRSFYAVPSRPKPELQNITQYRVQ